MYVPRIYQTDVCLFLSISGALATRNVLGRLWGSDDIHGFLKRNQRQGFTGICFDTLREDAAHKGPRMEPPCTDYEA